MSDEPKKAPADEPPASLWNNPGLLEGDWDGVGFNPPLETIAVTRRRDGTARNRIQYLVNGRRVG
jgi:hypothetical protein